ncbi:MAG: cytochrome c-type biogenesis protein [bacterium]
MMRRTLGVMVIAALAWAWGGSTSASGAPTLDDQVYAIAGELMCPVCSGQTVAESGSALAEQMRAIIRERLRAGQSRDEIIAYFVGQFGESVLAAPPRRGGGLAVWLIPPAALGIGLMVLRRFIRRTRSPVGSVREVRAPSPPTAAEAEQIRRELRDLD